jgi:hypothetical protein
MMHTAAQRTPDDVAVDAADARGHVSDGAVPPACAGLSNDFLNHYSEVLMLIEMAASDPDVGAELMDWRPMSYPAYFAASALRRASEALAAYDALPDDRRQAFERLVAAMDTLATMATFALQPPSEGGSAGVVVDETAPALRALIAKAGVFLNSGGLDLAPEGESEETQAVIDRIIGQAGSRTES